MNPARSFPWLCLAENESGKLLPLICDRVKVGCVKKRVDNWHERQRIAYATSSISPFLVAFKWSLYVGLTFKTVRTLRTGISLTYFECQQSLAQCFNTQKALALLKARLKGWINNVINKQMLEVKRSIWQMHFRSLILREFFFQLLNLIFITI